jgi:hypothetical protein
MFVIWTTLGYVTLVGVADIGEAMAQNGAITFKADAGKATRFETEREALGVENRLRLIWPAHVLRYRVVPYEAREET